MTIADVIAARTGHDESVAASDGPRAGRPKRPTFTAEYKLRERMIDLAHAYIRTVSGLRAV